MLDWFKKLFKSWSDYEDSKTDFDQHTRPADSSSRIDEQENSDEHHSINIPIFWKRF